MNINYKNIINYILPFIVFYFLLSGNAIGADVKYAQQGSILVRNGTLYSGSPVGHAGVFLDKDQIAQANGVGYLSSIRTYSGFLGGDNTYLGHFRTDLTAYQESVFRDWVEYYADKAIGKSYTGIHLYAYPMLDFSHSDGVPYSGVIPTDFRCDGLAEWSVEQARATYYGGSPLERYGFYDDNYFNHNPVSIAYTYGTTDTPPNLSVNSVDVPNGSYSSGESISVSNSTENTGGGPTTYSIKFYASTNTSISSSDILIASYSRNLIEYDEIDSYSSPVNLPTAPGTYYIGMIAEFTLNGVNYTKNGYDSSPIEVTPTLSSITISGLPQVDESSGAQYTCTANYSDGSTSNVTSSASWSQNSSDASINSSSGYLTTFAISSDKSCTITATYGGKSDTHSVTIKNDIPSENLNVALQANGGTATAGSTGTYMGITYPSSNANDDDETTAWCNSGWMPDWLKIEFDQAHVINEVGVVWGIGVHNQTYSISLSEDGANWQVVVPSRASATDAGDDGGYHGNTTISRERFAITPTYARFIRIDVTATSAPASHIFQAIVTELQAFTESTAPAATLADAISVLQLLVGTTPATSIERIEDINNDGKIGMEEVIYILQEISGLR